MKIRIRIVLFFTVLCFCLPAFSQQKVIPVDSIVNLSDQITEARPVEKVYLHFDRPYYAIGDTIWFKAYLTVATNQLSGLSRIVYVDVISSRDSLVKSYVLRVVNGVAEGSIPLTSPKYKQDNYHFKAYSKWMMNFDADYFFHKTIMVGNAQPKSLNGTISINRSESNGVPKISADILFKNSEGEPLSKTKINWYVAAGFNEIASGKGVTDQKGFLNVSFVPAKPSDLSAAVLTAEMDGGKNKIIEKVFPMKSVAQPSDVQFFPEGGNLIAGIPSKVAVKAVQPNGLGIGFSASITDNSGNTVSTVTSQHAGMGVFIITPEAGKTYKASVDFKDGTKGTYDLPKVQPSGFTITVNSSDTSKLVVRMIADPEYLKNHNGQTYYLFGKTGQQIHYSAAFPLNKQSAVANVSTKDFPTGIAQLTLLTSAGEPVSERIVFINHQDQLNVAINTDKKVYGPRQKITLDVLSKYGASAKSANLSISVIDESKLPVDENTESTILTHLLLTSDLKGYIEAPNYYFNNVNEKTRSELDILMLSQGYRRFTYQEIVNKQVSPIKYWPELNGLELSGTLRTMQGLPYKGRLNVQIPDRYYTSPPVMSDAEGKFKFTNLAFGDTSLVVVHAKDNVNAKGLMIMMDGAAFPATGKNPNYADENLNIDTVMTTYLANLKKVSANSNILQEVTIKTKSTVKAPSYADHSALAGLSAVDAQQLPATRFQDCPDLISCIQSIAPGVTYDQTTVNFYVTRDYNAGRRVPMAIFVRDMFMDINALSNVDKSKLESVEIFLNDALGLVNSTNRTNGVIVVNMKKDAVAPAGDRISFEQYKSMLPVPYIQKLHPNGYAIGKEFYSPKYLVANANYMPDQRATIYWNPRLLVDTSGKNTVGFYSADSRGTYRVVVEGVDADGNLGHSVYRFKVE